MAKYIFEKLELSIPFTMGGSTSFTLKAISGKESLKAERRKIYIVKDEGEFLYVGEANTSIKTRFQRSFISYRFFTRNKKSRGGYKGYKWIGHYAEKSNKYLSVYVAVFGNEYDNDRAFIEAIEGELVFLIRKAKGYWPEFQNEIHFNNKEGSKEIAEEIFEKLNISLA